MASDSANSPTETTSTKGDTTTTGMNNFIPDKPTMGGLEQIGQEHYATWTGGKPNTMWSALEDPNPPDIEPTQYRPTSVSSAAKQQHYRITGLITKFTKDSNLLTFQRDVTDHLNNYGMDTITYLPNPQDSSMMISILTDHAKFDNTKVASMEEPQASKYDKYDKGNIRDAKKFLMNSLDPELKKQMHESCKDTDSFIAYWMNLMTLVRPHNYRQYTVMQKNIESRKIQDYPGEDVMKLCSDFLSDYKELEGAGMYLHDLTYSMLSSLMEGGGPNNEDYRSPLRTLKDKLNAALLHVRLKSYGEQTEYMLAQRLDVHSVLNRVKQQYLAVWNEDKWPAKAHATDSKAIKQSYGSVNKTSTDAIAFQLTQLLNRDKSNDTCNNCGEKGHWAMECPKRSNTNRSSRPGPGRTNPRGGRGGRGGGGFRGGRGGRGSGRVNNARRPPGRPNSSYSTLPPPRDGESEIKMHEGKKLYYCRKCKKWTRSHSTDNHRSREGSSPPDGGHAGMARVSFDLHPAAFKAVFRHPDPATPNHSRTTPVFQSLFTLGFLGMLSGLVTWCLTNWSLMSRLGMLMGCTVLEHVTTHWLIYSLSLFSFTISAGTSYIVASRVISQPARIRYRSGPNYVKKYHRWKSRTSCNTTSPRLNHDIGSQILHDMATNRRRSHSPGVSPRYSHVPRPWRRHPPDQDRLFHLRSNLTETHSAIKIVQADLTKLRRRSKHLSADLRRLTSQVPSSEGENNNTRHCMCKKTMNSPAVNYLNKCEIHDDMMDDLFWFPGCGKPWPLAPACAHAELIHLDSISSQQANQALLKSPVLFDSGANCCITHDRSDFVGVYIKLTEGPIVDGIGKGLAIDGKGTVAWTFKDTNGMYRTLKVPCYHVPSSQTRIASIGCILKSYPEESVTITEHALTLSGNKVTGEGQIRIPMCEKTQLPMARAYPEGLTPSANATTVRNTSSPMGTLPGTVSLTEGANFNLADSEKELLKWHYRLGHIGMRRIQSLFRQDVLSSSIRTKRLHEAASKLTCGPLCTACQYAKQRRKTSPGSTTRVDKNSSGALKIDKMYPGQQVSVDHFYSSSKGRLLNTYGKESSDQKYVGGCIFVDHSSGLIHVELQTHLNSHETLNSKKSFEEMCSRAGVVVQNYLSDNGTAFRNQDFIKHLEAFHQTMKHSAVGAHHANGIAERNIGMVLSLARAMLHHSALHWPDVADVELWPLAVLHAVFILNRVPRIDNGMSPLELFTRKTWPRSKLQDLNVWGCPAYVLNGTLADGKKLPRWRPRSDRAVYVGHSPLHSSSVPLVLNLSSGHISPQYHVVFDNWFQTIGSTDSSQINFEHDDWYKTFGLTPWQYVVDDLEDRPRDLDHPGPFGPSSPRPPPAEVLQGSPHLVSSNDPPVAVLPHPTIPPDPAPEPSHRVLPPVVPVPVESVIEAPPAPIASVPPQREKVEVPPTETPQARPDPTPVHRPKTRSQAQPTLRRSSRTPKPKVYEAYFDYWCHYFDINGTSFPIAAKAKKNSDPDTYTWDGAMASEYKEEFLESARVEIAALAAEGTWHEDLRSNATNKIIPSQWVFRIKRSPDGEIRKFKGRIVLRGDLQEYEGETYSPVASWSAIRLMIIMCLRLQWITICIDFSSAFVQSPLPKSEPVWMHSPRGFACSKGTNYVLKLDKSLYGHKVAPLLWFNFVTTAFKELGLVQSEHDACLWYGKNLILVQYVDDCGIGAPDMKTINAFIEKLRKKGFKLTQEGSFAEFLGIKFERTKDESFKLTQKGLITKILQATEMEDCNPNSLPAPRDALGSDKNGEPYHESWNYRAVVGMLLYLSTNTRPDIAFAVSQIARHSADPKKSHASAVKSLLRYLKKTLNHGMVIHPTSKWLLDLYVDSDFCGLFNQEDERDPNSARSRMGYVIRFCGCPVIWKSQLMTAITQSTTEAEYQALSAALRVFLPLKMLIEEMIEQMCSSALEGAVVRATVFEDNQSAYYLATNQRITNRTRYFLTKWHWFWDQYNSKQFDIQKCPTADMLADYLTKQLAKDDFEKNRLAVQGW